MPTSSIALGTQATAQMNTNVMTPAVRQALRATNGNSGRFSSQEAAEEDTSVQR
jgi:hypothetical protein